MTDRILRTKEAAAKLGVNESTLWRWVKAGLLPKPIKLGPRAVGWLDSTLDAWLKARSDA